MQQDLWDPSASVKQYYWSCQHVAATVVHFLLKFYFLIFDLLSPPKGTKQGFSSSWLWMKSQPVNCTQIRTAKLKETWSCNFKLDQRSEEREGKGCGAARTADKLLHKESTHTHTLNEAAAHVKSCKFSSLSVCNLEFWQSGWCWSCCCLELS